ncbi:VPS9 domain [Trypanosoma melophagium]|uniref:VPS9 domain n=1 Tax=Trypanosoma melophagium TaxID=715481 RepID=UPI00351A1740|nr:VPS9 domain [Trypanosoma melophagium]
MNLPQLRRSINTIKDQCASYIMTESYLSQRGITDSEVVMCLEDIIQKLVITPNFDKIMYSLRTDDDLVNREELFNRKGELLRGKSAKVFNVRNDLRLINYRLVLRHFDLLMTLRNRNDILGQLVNIAACICLTVHVASKFNETALSLSHEIHEVMASQEGDNRNGNSLVESSRCTPIVLSVDAIKKTLPELSLSFLSGENSRRHDDAKFSMISLDISSENSEEKLPSSQLLSSSSIFALLEKDGLLADDMFPLYLHLLCESDVSDICLIAYFIEMMGDSDDTSERAYYFTTLTAAVAMVCEWTPETVVFSNSSIN